MKSLSIFFQRYKNGCCVVSFEGWYATKYNWHFFIYDNRQTLPHSLRIRMGRFNTSCQRNGTLNTVYSTQLVYEHCDSGISHILTQHILRECDLLLVQLKSVFMSSILMFFWNDAKCTSFSCFVTSLLHIFCYRSIFSSQCPHNQWLLFEHNIN